MRRIIKRFAATDRLGHPLLTNTERLADDGRGRSYVSTQRTVVGCPGCRRPISDLSELHGRCDYCRERQICGHCETRCNACARRLCWRCRRGFVGPPAVATCPTCYTRLRNRQLLQDRFAWQEAVFRRRMLLQREINRVHALRMQATRLRQLGTLAAIREMNKLQLAIMKARLHARRSLW